MRLCGNGVGKRSMTWRASMCLAVLLAMGTSSMAQLREWRVVKSGSSTVNFSAAAVAPDGATYLATWMLGAGSVKKTTVGRYGASGNIDWEVQLPDGQLVDHLAVDMASNVYLSGSTAAGTSDWVQRRNKANGAIGWTHTHALAVTMLYQGVVGRVQCVYHPATDSLIVLAGVEVESLTVSGGARQWLTTLNTNTTWLLARGQNSKLAVSTGGRLYVLLDQFGVNPNTSTGTPGSSYLEIQGSGAPLLYAKRTGSDFPNYSFEAAFGPGAVYYGSFKFDHEPYCDWKLYGPNGELIWGFGGTDFPPKDVQFVGTGLIYWNMFEGGFIRAALSGQTQWLAPDPYPLFVRTDEGLGGSRLIAATDRLTAYEDATGKRLWTYLAAGVVSQDLITVSKRLHAAGRSGATVVLDKLVQAHMLMPGEIGAGTQPPGSIQLDYPAPANGWLFTLQSNNPEVTVPATAFVPANATSVEFPITVSASATGQSVTLTARNEDATLFATAVVKATRVLTVKSTNPNSGVTLGATMDANGDGSGTTTFQRVYVLGSHVSISAGSGLLAGNKLFDHFEKDGVLLTGPLIMDANHTINAVYVQGYSLSVQSNPTGASMTVWVPDYFNRTNGTTSFNRLYKGGITAKVTAAAQVGSNWFHHWEKDGTVVPGGGKTIQVAMDANHTIKAIYTPAYQVAVDSLNPTSGVPITVWTADLNGLKNGTTSFTRTYMSGITASMTAPAKVGINRFDHWEIGGTAQPTGQKTISVNVTANLVLKCVFIQSYQLTVNSSNPNSGVPIVVSKADNLGLKDGNTSFARQYDKSSSVTLTAPASFAGKSFVKWVKDGVPLTVNRTTTVVIDGDHTYLAIFQ